MQTMHKPPNTQFNPGFAANASSSAARSSVAASVAAPATASTSRPLYPAAGASRNSVAAPTPQTFAHAGSAPAAFGAAAQTASYGGAPVSRASHVGGAVPAQPPTGYMTPAQAYYANQTTSNGATTNPTAASRPIAPTTAQATAAPATTSKVAADSAKSASSSAASTTSTSGSSSSKRKNSRIDPRMVPRAVTYPPPEKDKPVPNNAKIVYTTMAPPAPVRGTGTAASAQSLTGLATPPCGTLDYYVEDKGNCSPKFIRMTCWSIASTQELVDESHIGIAAIVQPLAASPLDEPIPVVPPMGDPNAPNAVDRCAPIRCARCAAYMNPFNIFEDRGKTFKCALCSRDNDVPHHYISNLDEFGFRRDRFERPELSRGSYDISVPSFTAAHPFTGPSFLFVIDVSYNSIVSQFLDAAIQSIIGSLPSLLEKFPSCKVGVMTFDSRVHFYTLGENCRQARMIVVADPKDGFAALPASQVLVPLASEHCWQLIHDLLNNLPTLFQQNKLRTACLGAAVGAAGDVMESCGGRIVMMTSSIAGLGQGKLEDREDSKVAGTPQETKVFGPQDSYYQIMATRMAERFISLDLYVGANSYVDLATISVLSKDTGGQVFYYSGFQFAKDGYALENDLYRALTRPIGFEAVMILRTSTGLKVVEEIGNFFRRNPGEIDLPIIDADKSFVIRLAHDGVLQTGQNAMLQVALLYTNENGERLIRIHNLSIPVTNEVSKIFRHADIDSIINVSMKQVVNHIHGSSTVETRKALREAAVDILYIYRKRCASNTSSGQLILPEALKLLPLYTLGMIKNGSLADYTPADDRIYLFNVINMMPVSLSVALCSPRLYALHKLPDGVCYWGEDGSFLLPDVDIVSKDFLDDSGVYLLDAGLSIYLWIGEKSDPSIIYELFGLESLDHVDLYQLAVYGTEDPYALASRTSALIEYLRMNRPFYANLRVLSQKHMLADSLDFRRFWNSLIEDEKQYLKGEKPLGSESDRMSYVDFLCYLHRKIQDKFV